MIASDVDAECTADDVQVAILLGNGEWPGFRTTMLFAEEVFPVCSPGYLNNSKTQVRLDNIANETLLELSDHHWNWMNWRLWLSNQGVALPTAHRAMQLNSYPLLIESAKNGMGIALGWGVLVDEDINSGKLVRPLADTLHTEQGYFLLRRERSLAMNEVDHFCHWLTDQFQT